MAAVEYTKIGVVEDEFAQAKMECLDKLDEEIFDAMEELETKNEENCGI